MKRSECYLVSPTILNLPYTNGTELGEEPIEVSHHKDLQPKKLTSFPDKMPPTPLDKMSPLPHNNANEGNIICPEVPEAPTDQPENPPCSKSQSLTCNLPERIKRLPSRFKDFEM